MDFSVATIRCFDTVKVHHEKRWLRQQRLLCISTHEILNCPFPSQGSPASKIFELFSISQNEQQQQQQATSSPPSQAPSPILEPAEVLEARYKKACAILEKSHVSFDDIKKALNPTKINYISNVTGVMLKGTDHLCINLRSDHPYYYITPVALSISTILRTRFVAHSSARLVEGNFEDESMQMSLNVQKEQETSSVQSGTAGGGGGGSNLGSVAAGMGPRPASTRLQESPAAQTLAVPSSAGGVGGGGAAGAKAPSVSSSCASPVSPLMAAQPPSNASFGYSRIADLFQAGVIELPSLSDVDHLQAAAMELTRALDWHGGMSPASVLVNIAAPLQNLEADVLSWVPKAPLPPTAALLDISQKKPLPQSETQAALPASSSSPPNPAVVPPSGSNGQPAKGGAVMEVKALDPQRLGASAASNNNNNNKNSNGGDGGGGSLGSLASPSPRPRRVSSKTIVVSTPDRAAEFRKRFNDIRQSLVQGFLVSNATKVVETEKSVAEKLAFWRTSKKIPTFEDPFEAELCAELALQNLLYRTPVTFQNLWADIYQAYREEMELFRVNCILLSSPSVPFSYFGIPKDFESVRFDLVRHHLLSLSSCRTPSSMLNAVVSAIKSVIVCVKARHVLSRRWSRACSVAPASASAFDQREPANVLGSRGGTRSPAAASSTTGSPAVAGASGSPNPIQGTPRTPPVANTANTTMTTTGAYWTREELDDIAAESQKHSLYNTDDILPVFIYILVYCGLPNLALYHRYLEVLGYDAEASERSFYVTVFSSAIQWVLEWKKPKKKKSVPPAAVPVATTAATTITTTANSSDQQNEAAASSFSLSPSPSGEEAPNKTPIVLDDDGNDDADGGHGTPGDKNDNGDSGDIVLAPPQATTASSAASPPAACTVTSPGGSQTTVVGSDAKANSTGGPDGTHPAATADDDDSGDDDDDDEDWLTASISSGSVSSFGRGPFSAKSVATLA